MCRVSVVSYAADQLDQLRLGVHQVGPPGEVDGRQHARLVERHHRVTEPSDTGLVTERLAQRLPDGERGVLDGVVRVDVEVALRAAPSRSSQPCLPSWESMWSKKGTPVSTSTLPVPSSVELDEDRRLLGGALHAGGTRCGGRHATDSFVMAVRAVEERSRLLRGAGGDTQVTGHSDIPDQDAGLEQLAPQTPTGRRRRRRRRSCASEGYTSYPRSVSVPTMRSRCTFSASTHRSSSSAWSRAAQTDRLSDR